LIEWLFKERFDNKYLMNNRTFNINIDNVRLRRNNLHFAWSYGLLLAYTWSVSARFCLILCTERSLRRWKWIQFRCW